MIRQEAFAGIRKRLDDERASLQDQIASLVTDNQGQQDDYGVGNHLADDATEVFTGVRFGWF